MKASERKEQILNAALEAFSKHGYERTSIAIICEKAGIARPTLYQYFKDKRSVFRELLETYLADIHDELHIRQKTKDSQENLSPRETMLSFHYDLIEEFANNRNFYTILLNEAKAKNAETEDIVNGILDEMMHKFVLEFKENPGSENLSEKDIEFTVMYMIGGLLQTVEYYLFDDKHALPIQEVAEKITDIELRIKGI